MRFKFVFIAVVLMASSVACSSDDPVPIPVRLLEFVTEPGNGTGGSALVVQPVVKVTDADGVTVLSSSVVTLTITAGTGTAGAQVVGAATVAAIDGIATFSGIGVDLTGNGYTFDARAVNKTPATSAVFNVTPGPAVQVQFAAAVANVQVDTTTPTIDVHLLDAGGNLTTATNTVTLAILANPGNNIMHGWGRSPASFESYDPVSATVIPITTTATQVGGLVYEASTNLVLTADWGGGGGQWIELDPVTGAENSLSTSLIRGGEQGLAFDAVGTIFGVGSQHGVSDETLFSYDRADGTFTIEGAVTVGGDTVGTFHGLARDPVSDTMYVVFTLSAQRGGEPRYLATLDTATRVATVVGAVTESNISGITFTPDGQMFAVLCGQGGLHGTLSPGSLCTVDKATGDMTLVTALSGSTVRNHGIVRVPGQIQGALSQAALSGVAQFTLSFTAAANGYTLQATSPGLVPDTSNAFNVTP